jgi:hypothetical protein
MELGMRTKILAATTVAASLILAACGGGDSAATPPSLSGTAAVGMPIVGGTVDVVCAGGSALSTTTGSAGAWQVATSGQTLPCAVRVSRGTVGGSANGTPYHSIALSFDTVNITPLTDLVIANLAGKAPAAWFSGINAAALQGVSNAAVNGALGKVNAALGLTATLNGANPLTTSFTATNGNLIDDILEAIAKARQAAGLEYAAFLALAAQTNFSAPTSFNFSTAYAAVKAAGGGTNAACKASEIALTYDSSVSGGPHTNGQKLCFTVSPTSLAFSGKTLGNPTANPAVVAPYSAYSFADGAYTYEVIFKSGALHEINVSDASKFYGQFAAPASGGTGGTGGNANLTVNFTAGGIAGPAISVSNVPAPGSESEFCQDMPSNAVFAQIGALGGGNLTMNSCSFTGNVGKVNATLNLAGVAIPHVITFTYQ